MQLLLYVVFIFLWSCQNFASDEITLSAANLNFTNAFTKISDEYTSNKELIEIPNMPRIRSQDSFGICYGMAANTIAQKYICDYSIKYKDKNCSNLDKNLEISPLDTLALALTNEDGDDEFDKEYHTNLRISSEDRRSASGFRLLKNLSSIPNLELNAESCFEFDKVVEKHQKTTGDQIVKLLEKLKIFFEKSKNKIKTKTEAIGLCPECEELLGKLDKVQFNEAISKKNFGEFLYKVVFNKDCNEKILLPLNIQPKINTFPNESGLNKSEESIQKFIQQIKTNIINGNPMLIQNICAATKKKEDIKNGCFTHATVISGYKLSCNKSNSCIPFVRIHNSYGKDWQNQNKDGWVDATLLIKNIHADENKYLPNSLTWYEPKKGTPKNPPPPPPK